MSEQSPVIYICRKCNRVMTPTGGVMMLELDHPKIKGGFRYREYVCNSWGIKMTIGYFTCKIRLS